MLKFFAYEYDWKSHQTIEEGSSRSCTDAQVHWNSAWIKWCSYKQKVKLIAEHNKAMEFEIKKRLEHCSNSSWVEMRSLLLQILCFDSIYAIDDRIFIIQWNSNKWGSSSADFQQNELICVFSFSLHCVQHTLL